MSELTNLRTLNSRTYEQPDGKRTMVQVLGTHLHYSSNGDSSLDSTVDMTFNRVNNASFDGWTINAAAWHYAIGKDLANHGNEDGWIGFGGRRGQHWFKFRLERVGYLHWPTRNWQVIANNPNYTRSNITSNTESLILMEGEDPVNAISSVVWDKIWTTPGGGSLSIEWRPEGRQLKEEIKINAAARSWITANAAPSTPASETWLSFVFKLDWSDIPKVYRNQILQSIEGDFADDGSGIELRNATEELIAFLPVDYAWASSNELQLIDLRKRFYKDNNGNYYLVVGAKVSDLASLPSGDIIFDPSTTIQPDATDGNDTFILNATATTNYGTNALIAIGDSSAAASAAYRILIKFDLSGLPSNANISSTTFSMYEYAAYDTASTGSWSASMYALLRDWSESQATWNIYSTGNNWNTAGATGVYTDIGATAESITLDGTAASGFVDWSGSILTAFVQGVVNGDYTNYGFLIIAPTAESKGVSPMSANLFRSSDYGTAGDRPKITITYGYNYSFTASSASATSSSTPKLSGRFDLQAASASASSTSTSALKRTLVMVGNSYISTVSSSPILKRLISPAPSLAASSSTNAAKLSRIIGTVVGSNASTSTQSSSLSKLISSIASSGTITSTSAIDLVISSIINAIANIQAASNASTPRLKRTVSSTVSSATSSNTNAIKLSILLEGIALASSVTSTSSPSLKKVLGSTSSIGVSTSAVAIALTKILSDTVSAASQTNTSAIDVSLAALINAIASIQSATSTSSILVARQIANLASISASGSTSSTPLDKLIGAIATSGVSTNTQTPRMSRSIADTALIAIVSSSSAIELSLAAALSGIASIQAATNTNNIKLAKIIATTTASSVTSSTSAITIHSLIRGVASSVASSVTNSPHLARVIGSITAASSSSSASNISLSRIIDTVALVDVNQSSNDIILSLAAAYSIIANVTARTYAQDISLSRLMEDVAIIDVLTDTPIVTFQQLLKGVSAISSSTKTRNISLQEIFTIFVETAFTGYTGDASIDPIFTGASFKTIIDPGKVGSILIKLIDNALTSINKGSDFVESPAIGSSSRLSDNSGENEDLMIQSAKTNSFGDKIV